MNKTDNCYGNNFCLSKYIAFHDNIKINMYTAMSCYAISAL